MELTVWIIQGILALMFLMAGIMKSTQPKDKLVKSLPWVNDFSLQTVRFIGFSELTGAIGIIIPQVTGILPILSPIAAVGLVIIMILAASHHIRKNEFKEVAFNAVLLVLSAFVAYYRF
ncbi:MAG: DoxX family protein [Bacteroidales bacterium]